MCALKLSRCNCGSLTAQPESWGPDSTRLTISRPNAFLLGMSVQVMNRLESGTNAQNSRTNGLEFISQRPKSSSWWTLAWLIHGPRRSQCASTIIIYKMMKCSFCSQMGDLGVAWQCRNTLLIIWKHRKISPKTKGCPACLPSLLICAFFNGSLQYIGSKILNVGCQCVYG